MLEAWRVPEHSERVQTMFFLRVPKYGRVVPCDVTGANAGLPTPREHCRVNTWLLATEFIYVGVPPSVADLVWILDHHVCNN